MFTWRTSRLRILHSHDGQYTTTEQQKGLIWMRKKKKKKKLWWVGVGGLEGCRRRVLFSWGVSSRCPNQQLTLTRPSTWFTVTLHFIQTRSRHDLNFFWRTSRRKLHLDYYLTFYFLKFVLFCFQPKKETKQQKKQMSKASWLTWCDVSCDICREGCWIRWHRSHVFVCVVCERRDNSYKSPEVTIMKLEARWGERERRTTLIFWQRFKFPDRLMFSRRHVNTATRYAGQSRHIHYEQLVQRLTPLAKIRGPG